MHELLTGNFLFRCYFVFLSKICHLHYYPQCVAMVTALLCPIEKYVKRFVNLGTFFITVPHFTLTWNTVLSFKKVNLKAIANVYAFCFYNRSSQ